MAMATVRRESPFVQVYAANEKTIVHIRQLVCSNMNEIAPFESKDGIVMTLMQFRSLMFHLRALDAQFTQGIECSNDVDDDHDTHYRIDNDVSSCKKAGEKRSWHESNDDDNKMQKIDEAKRNEVIDEIANHAWSEMEDILAAFDPASTGECNVVQQPEQQKAPEYNEKVPVKRRIDNDTTKVLTQVEVRDELARVYAEKLISMLPELVRDACTGCKNSIDRHVYAHQHDVCMFLRKKRIDLFATRGVLLTDDASVRTEVSTRLESRQLSYKPEWLNEDKNNLVLCKKWLQKVKRYAIDI